MQHQLLKFTAEEFTHKKGLDLARGGFSCFWLQSYHFITCLISLDILPKLLTAAQRPPQKRGLYSFPRGSGMDSEKSSALAAESTVIT